MKGGGGLFYILSFFEGVGFGPNLTNRLTQMINNHHDLKASCPSDQQISVVAWCPVYRLPTAASALISHKKRPSFCFIRILHILSN